MVDVTAFGRVQSPLRPGGLATVAALERGAIRRDTNEDRKLAEESRLMGTRAFDQWSSGDKDGFQNTLGLLAGKDPERAEELFKYFGTVDRTNFVESAMHIYNAARQDDPELQNKALGRAMDVMGTQADHPFVLGLQEIKDMPYETEDDMGKRHKALMSSVDIADQWNAYPRMKDARSTRAKDPTATDIDDYIFRARTAYFNEHGVDMPPEMQNEKALEFKRAQAPEVTATTQAKKEVESKFAKRLAYNAELGRIQAETFGTPALIEAKGEMTPVAKREAAQNNMSFYLNTLFGHYSKLDKWGAIQNIDETSMSNAFATARSSAGGQALGRLFGTEPQSVRQSIKNMKPILINTIRQASEMGARGIDSEKELEFYLQAATNEKADIQSNLAAIAVLDGAYGTGDLINQLSKNPVYADMIKHVQTQASIERTKWTRKIEDWKSQGKEIVNRAYSDDGMSVVAVQFSDGTFEEIQ
jgi:hypothetical protein